MSDHVISTAFQLTKPRNFEATILEHRLKDQDVVVEPYLASVCHADLRYYTGNRRPEALKEKLPMALFHEGLAIVKQSRHPKFNAGDRVVIVPSIPGYVLNHTSPEQCCEHCRKGGEPNYCLKGAFLGSGYDGIAQSRLVIGGENLVLVPEGVDDRVAVLAELSSVSVFAIQRVEKSLKKARKVAVFGDGPLGYLTTAILSHIYNVPKKNLLLFGADYQKIAEFNGMATTAHVQETDFNTMDHVDLIFECTGGRFSASAINQGIELIERDGTIVLMGVTEELVSVNTRDVLEKGLKLKGSSRSTTKDFQILMEAFQKKPFVAALEKLVPDDVHRVKTTKDLTKTMETAAQQKGWKKTYIKFDWK